MSRVTIVDRAILAVLLAYALGFVAFPPRTLLIVDESRYVAQAVAFARGQTTLPNARVVVPEESALPSDYPPGTSLVQAPFVAAGSALSLPGRPSWSYAAWVSVLGLVVLTLATRAWLREASLNTAFALAVPLYLGSLFFGRVAMSDMPAAAVMGAALLLIWRWETRGSHAIGVTAGFACGAILLFREPPVLLVLPFALGALLRKRGAAWPLVVGGLAAIVLRAALARWLFGDPFYLRDPEYGFSIGSVAHNAIPYAIILTIFLPAALVLPFLYRGPRRPEFLAACALYLTMLLTFEWDTVVQNGLAKGTILSTRYVLPAVPILVFMAAHRWGERLGRLARPNIAMTTAIAAALAAFLVHPALRRLEAEPLAVTHAIQAATSAGVPVITNHDATFKYLSPAYSDRRLILRNRITPDDVPELLRRYGRLQVLLLDRGDSDAFRADAEKNAEFVARLSMLCRMHTTEDRELGATLRLRVYDVTSCG